MHQPAWTESEDHSWRVGPESRELKGVALVGWLVGSLTGEMLVVITGSWPLSEDTVPSCWLAVALLP